MVSRREDEEFDAFMTASWSSLYRTAVLMTGDHAPRRGLLQNTMGKVYKSWRRVSRVEHPRSYARAILANEVATWWRRRSSSELPVETWPETTSTSGLDDQVVDADLMWQALSRLPARQRAVVVLRYYEDLSGAEVAPCPRHQRGGRQVPCPSRAPRARDRADSRRRQREGATGMNIEEIVRTSMDQLARDLEPTMPNPAAVRARVNRSRRIRSIAVVGLAAAVAAGAVVGIAELRDRSNGSGRPHPSRVSRPASTPTPSG